MKVAIVYDRVNKWGGAERVLLALNKMFPDAPLYTSVYDARGAPWAKVFPKIHTSFLQHLPGAKVNHEKLALLMPVAFEQFDFSDYDLVISVTSEAAKGIITQPHTKHVCICLTPTRYLWSGYGEYFGLFAKVLSRPFIAYLRLWDKVAAQRPDKMVAISTEVQERIRRYYGRESTLIYPPVGFGRQSRRQMSDVRNREHYLIVSRLVPYKKVDLVVEAFNKLGKKLVVVGTGSEERKLKRRAGGNILFMGKLTDEELADYYESARALVMPQHEDFGLVSVEAQSFGTPVLAYGAGGALDTITSDTGMFFDKQTPEAIVAAVKKFEKKVFDEKKIRTNADRFSQAKFHEEFMKLI